MKVLLGFILIIQAVYARHFSFNAAVPNLLLAQELLQICTQIEEGYKGIIIEGHTDKRGSELYNLKLGKKRADVAKVYLADLCGLDLNKIKTVSMGETEATGNHKEDRKVVIHLLQSTQKTIVVKDSSEFSISPQQAADKSKLAEDFNKYFISFNISNPYVNIQTRHSTNWAEAAIERSWALGVQGYKKIDKGYYLGVGFDTAKTFSLGVGFGF